MKTKPCEYDINLTDDEYGGIQWLIHLLDRIRSNPNSVSPAEYIGAAKMAQALNKLRAYCDFAHEEMHRLNEHKISKLPMVVQKPAQA